MEKYSNKKKLIEILDQLSKQTPQKSFHSLCVQKHINIPVVKVMTKNGKNLLNKQVNQIVQKQNKIVTQKEIDMEIKQYKDMKHKLKLYGKNKFEYVIDKIIRFQRKKYIPLHHIHQIDEQKVMISRQHNIRLSQKVDSIIQAQNIQKSKKQKKKFLQSKNRSPLIQRLTAVRSFSSQNASSFEKNKIKSSTTHTNFFESKIKYSSQHKFLNETHRQTSKNSTDFFVEFNKQNIHRLSEGCTNQSSQNQLFLNPAIFQKRYQAYQGSRKLKLRKIQKQEL